MLSDKWPDSYTITVDSSPYYGAGDGFFHPSSHAVSSRFVNAGERYLWYLFNPKYKGRLVFERRSVQAEITLAMGSAIHAVVQTQFMQAGLLRPENVEVEYVNVEHHVRGRIDFIVDHPSGRRLPVELKSLACSTPILTTAGWTTMGALRDGDEVYAPDGQPTKVLKAHPVNLGRPCYEVSFRDGQKVVTDAEHLWSVDDRAGGNRVMTTKEIADANWYGRNRFRVPVTEPLQMPDRELPIDPWLLGAWLGDGDSSMVSICSSDGDLPYLTGRVEDLGLRHTVHRYGDKAPKLYVGGLRRAFSELALLRHPRTGLDGRKHIPQQYLLGSEAQRRELLAGLMDSDGTVGDHQAVICMTNEPLMRQVLQLVRSLGYRATWNESRARLDGKDCGPVYWVKFSTAWGPSPFAMPRKKAAWDGKAKGSLQNLRLNSITAVTSVPTVPVRCITVAHESELYVAGEGFVPTHNTQNSNAFARQDSPKPEWEAQLSLGLDNCGEELGVLMVLEAGYPYRMKEFPVSRNDSLLTQIYTKFDQVREALDLGRPPRPCCSPESNEMKQCPARFVCWLSRDPEEHPQ